MIISPTRYSVRLMWLACSLALAGCSLSLESRYYRDVIAVDHVLADNRVDGFVAQDAADGALPDVDIRDAQLDMPANDTARDATSDDGAMIDGGADAGCVARSIVCGVGVCRRVYPGCVDGGAASCPVLPPSMIIPEVCNGLDDDCNGMVDDGIPAVQCGFGVCASAGGCVGGRMVSCTGLSVAAPEVCGNGMDDDCDGIVDDGCRCDRYVSAGSVGDGLIPTSPAGTIGTAIARMLASGSLGTICVGALPSSMDCAATYHGSVQMVEGITILGGFRAQVTSATRWIRDPACVTTIASGVEFPASITNATALDGFTIAAAAGSIATIRMGGAGRFSNNRVFGGASGASVGVVVTENTGATNGPVIALNDIHGQSATAFSVSLALIAQSPGIRVLGNTLAAGIANGTSVGLDLTGSRNAVVADNTISADTAPLSIGMRLTTDVSGVVVTRNNIEASGDGAAAGVWFDRTTMGPARILGNRRIVGGSIAENTAGIEIGTASSATILVDSNELIVGTPTGGMASGFGVHCGGGRCLVRNNGRIIGIQAGPSTGTGAVGVSIDVAAQGEVRDNQSVTGCLGGAPLCHGILIASAAGTPVVEGNVVHASVARASEVSLHGITTGGSNSIIANNVVFTDATHGITIVTQATSPVTEATVHSNTIIAAAPASNTRVAGLLNFENNAADGQPAFGGRRHCSQ